MENQNERSAASVRTAELAVAGLIFFLGALVVYDSWRIGARWAEDGPQGGYFPFYIGLLLCISSFVTIIFAVQDRKSGRESFVSVPQLKLVMSMLVPTVVYVVLVSWLGIYVASTIFVAFFMIWLGRYSWLKTAAVSIGNSVVFFLLFEVWFKVPLPKGPLEAALGFG